MSIDALKPVLLNLIEKNKEYGIVFRYCNWETDFLRFYHSQTNYNISKQFITLSVTLEKNKKKYTYRLSNPDHKEIESAFENAKTVVDRLPEDTDFDSFEDNKDEYFYSDVTDAIAAAPLEQKIEILQPLADAAEKHNFDTFGTFITLKINEWIVNSNGLDKHFYQSPVFLDIKAVSNTNMATVIDSFGGNSMSGYKADHFADSFEQKIKNACLPVVDIDAGEYDVVLAPHAVAQFLEFYISGAYAQNLDNQTSCFEGKVGEKILPEIISVGSYPNRADLIRFPYNADGHIAEDITVIEKGIFKNFFVDHYYSKKLKLPKNGAVGTNALTLEAGKSSLQSMISGIKHGIYISNLHYMNFINEKDTSVTGLTRDGTFLIQGGKIVNLANNLRFTVKLSDVFGNCSDLENRLTCVPQSQNYDDFKIYSSLTPHIKTSGFKISSSTKTI